MSIHKPLPVFGLEGLAHNAGLKSAEGAHILGEGLRTAFCEAHVVVIWAFG